MTINGLNSFQYPKTYNNNNNKKVIHQTVMNLTSLVRGVCKSIRQLRSDLFSNTTFMTYTRNWKMFGNKAKAYALVLSILKKEILKIRGNVLPEKICQKMLDFKEKHWKLAIKIKHHGSVYLTRPLSRLDKQKYDNKVSTLWH